MDQTKKQTYFVKGMHCASCELLIERKLLDLKNLKSVKAKTNDGKVTIEYEGEEPSIDKLNQIFKKHHYIFSNQPMENESIFKKNDYLLIFGIALLIIIAFIILNKFGLTGLASVNAKSSLPAFFVFGLIAGISSCAALVGGLILSLSKQWSDLYTEKDSTSKKIQPHLMFNTGRLISYAFFGAILGLIGKKLQLSLTFTSILVIAISVMMIFLGLQMLGFKAFRRFQLTVPKFITRYVADEKNFKGRYAPFVLGAFTFILPCGFTITAQGLALISGSPIQGALIMLLFALGTLPMLLAIGFSSVKLTQSHRLSSKFLKIAGVLVMFFALFNINSQLNVLGLKSLNNLSFKSTTAKKNTDITPTVDEKQVIKMQASATGYQPNYFKVNVGIPVRWEIEDVGTSGCTSAVISKDLFDGEIPLTHGQTSVKEFTPEKTGKFKFSCWMGMVTGIIEVVDKNSASKSASNSNVNTSINSQNTNNSSCSANGSGCGCGCGQK